jgi:hypothetical protein
VNHVITEDRSELCDLLERARENAAPAGWSYTVKVWALGDPIQWVIESKLRDPQTGNLVFNKNNDHMPKRDYYVVNFELHDFSGLQLRFEPNPRDAFWVAVGDRENMPPCPGSAAYSDQIYAICDDTGGMKLTIRNDDLDQVLFSYSLGFVSDLHGSKHRCDPGGDNQNGNYTYRYDY